MDYILTKKSLIAFLSIFSFFIAAYYFGVRDIDEYDDQGLLKKITEVPANQNGYFPIAYMLENDFEFPADKEAEEELKSHIYHNSWNENFVNTLTNENGDHIEAIISSSNHDSFKFASSGHPTDLPNYLPVMNSFRLVILHAIAEAKAGNLEQSIELTRAAINFGQSIKTESNSWLISHMIGLVLQYESLLWVHHLVSDYDLDADQFESLAAALNSIATYRNDSFEEVFSGELIFSERFTDLLVNRSLAERWTDYWDMNDWWNQTEETNLYSSVKGRLFNFMSSMFPRYYTHKNRMLNDVVPLYAELAKQSKSFCNKVEVQSTQENHELQWIDLIRPNSTMDQMRTNPSLFLGYYSRRCFGHTYIESLKAIVAIKAYHRDNQQLPDTLSDLIPRYIRTLPVDPFNGEPLKYSKSNQWLYSVGTNFEDNAGSTSGYYFRRCENEDTCSENPTIPITPNPSEYIRQPKAESFKNIECEEEYVD